MQCFLISAFSCLHCDEEGSSLNGNGNRCSDIMHTRGMNNSVHPVDIGIATAMSVSGLQYEQSDSLKFCCTTPKITASNQDEVYLANCPDKSTLHKKPFYVMEGNVNTIWLHLHSK